MIDLRSDTVTKPSEEMRKVMYSAEVGDDVYGEDPTINELQEYTANLFGKEAALFVPSGTMANQLCLNILTEPGDEVICEADAHIFHFESGSPAALSGIQLSTVKGKNGVLSRKDVEPRIRPASAYYMALTKVIEIENTHNVAGGIVQPIEKIAELSGLAKEYGLYTHLDGARIWNASVATGIGFGEYGSYFDTVSVCMSKGLGAPVGSVIAGPKELIDKAFRKRKAWGGGMRQAGIIAAGALYAVKNNIERLIEDHAKASEIAGALAKTGAVDINAEAVQTNIIMFRPLNKSTEEVLSECSKKGLAISGAAPGLLRIVTHLDLTWEDTAEAIKIMEEVLGN